MTSRKDQLVAARENAKQKLAKINEQIRAAAAREAAAERKVENRQKYIAGSFLLEHIKNNTPFSKLPGETVREFYDKVVKLERDRVALGLAKPPAPEKADPKGGDVSALKSASAASAASSAKAAPAKPEEKPRTGLTGLLGGKK